MGLEGGCRDEGGAGCMPNLLLKAGQTPILNTFFHAQNLSVIFTCPVGGGGGGGGSGRGIKAK